MNKQLIYKVHLQKECYCCLFAVVSDSFAMLWTVACQVLLSMGFPRQEYWSGLLFPSPGIFPIQGSNLQLLHWQMGSLPPSHQGGT